MSARLRVFIATLFVLALANPSPARLDAQTGPATIVGSVVDASLKPIAGAKITTVTTRDGRSFTTGDGGKTWKQLSNW